MHLIPVVLCAIGIPAIIMGYMLERTRKGKPVLEKEIQILPFGIELADEMEEEIVEKTVDPRIHLVSRSEDVKRNEYSIYIGLADFKSPDLALPDGEGAFYGYPLVSIEIDFRGTKKIQVCFEEYPVPKGKKKFPFRIQDYGIDDTSRKKLIQDVVSWVAKSEANSIHKLVS